MSHRFVLAAALLVLFLPIYAHAAPIAYNEATDPDLPDTSGLPTFTLDIGTNTVTGTMTSGSPDFADSFAFVVPAGTQLTNVNLSVTSLSASLTATGGWWLYRGSSSWASGTLLDTLSAMAPPAGTTTDSVVAGLLPLAADLYNLSWNQTGGSPSYVFSLTVTPTAVPEPTSLLLLGTALAGTLARRYRRKS